MMWSEFPEGAECGEPFPCDYRGCDRDATHAYIGESGDFFLCSIHYQPTSPPIQKESRGNGEEENQ